MARPRQDDEREQWVAAAREPGLHVLEVACAAAIKAPAELSAS